MIKLMKDRKFIRDFFRIAFPVMLQNFVIFLTSFLDNIMVGSVSNNAISSVYAANQVTFIFFIMAWGVIAGAGVMMQQFAGAKDNQSLRSVFLYKLVVMTIFLALIIPIAFIFGDRIIWFYCHSDQNAQEILKLGQQYLFIMVFSYIPLSYSIVLASTLREIGKTKYPFPASVGALIINVVLNLIFIYQLRLGVAGAAYASLIARVVEFLILLCIVIFTKQVFIRKLLSSKKMEKNLLSLIVNKSWPLFLNEIFWVGGMIMISLAYAQRSNVLSALSVISTMSDIFGIIFQGLSAGIGIMVGNNLGRNEIEKVKKDTLKIYVLGVSISLILGAIMVALSPFIPLMFTKIDDSQKSLATQLIIVFGICMWAFSMCTVGYNVLRAGGKSLLTFILDSGIMWLFVVPLAWIFTLKTGSDLIIIYLIVQSFDIIKAIIGFIIVKKGKWANNLVAQFQK